MTQKILKFHQLKEDPDLWEHLIEVEIEKSASCQDAMNVVQAMYWDRDREAAFQRYLASIDFRQTLELLDVFHIPRNARLCEIGGGSGQLSWALAKSGFEKIELLEPNARWITGTGFLRTQLDQSGGKIRICNDLDEWYDSNEHYQFIATRNCIHHFKNIAMTAAAIRQKIERGGMWVAIREWYADTPAEMNKLMLEHPYSQKYCVYEFPFPASHYVDSIEYGGFKLVGVVPLGWGNSHVAGFASPGDVGSKWNQRTSRIWRAVFSAWPTVTVALYRLESALNRTFGLRLRSFSRPQMMVFQRIEIDARPADH